VFNYLPVTAYAALELGKKRQHGSGGQALVQFEEILLGIIGKFVAAAPRCFNDDLQLAGFGLVLRTGAGE
jgi:hypothetical protein